MATRVISKMASGKTAAPFGIVEMIKPFSEACAAEIREISLRTSYQVIDSWVNRHLVEEMCAYRPDVSYLGVSDMTGITTSAPDEDEPETKASGASSKVAFSASAAVGSLGDMRPRQRIVFETVYTNVGKGYDRRDGVFTAPVSGLYQFFASVMADQGQEVWGVFEFNSVKTLSKIYARGTDDRHAQGSQMIVLNMRKGDTLCVLNERGTRIYGDEYTTFSGFIVN